MQGVQWEMNVVKNGVGFRGGQMGHMKGLGVKRYPHRYLGTHRERTGYKEKRYAACTEGISKASR